MTDISHPGQSDTGWRAVVGAASPRTVLAILIVAQIVVWTLVPSVLATSLPLDVVSDGIGWGHEWQWGYYKHPPLPSWASEAFFEMFGDTGPFLLSQIAIALTYLFVYLAGCELMPAREAVVGTVLLVGVYYFSVPTPEFNHNVAQMPVWAAAGFAYLKALRSARLRWWALLGVIAGIGMLTKYSSAILYAAMLVHMVSTRSARGAFATPGPYLAIVLLFAVMAPHLVWLVHNHFPTLNYVQARAGRAPGLLAHVLVPLKFLLSQMVDLLPCLLLAAGASLLRFLPRSALPSPDDDDVRLLLFLGLGPALLTALLSLVTGYGIRDMWGAPMWNWTGLLLVALMRARWAKLSLPALYAGVAVLFVLLPLAYALATSFVPEWKGRPSRTQWPDRALAQTLSRAWTAQTGLPVRIVAGDGWLGGLIAMRLTPRASVFTDADPQHAPWITPPRLLRDGALVVWQVRGSVAPPPGLALKGLEIEGVKSFAWPDEPNAAPLRIGWGIVRPKSGHNR